MQKKIVQQSSEQSTQYQKNMSDITRTLNHTVIKHRKSPKSIQILLYACILTFFLSLMYNKCTERGIATDEYHKYITPLPSKPQMFLNAPPREYQKKYLVVKQQRSLAYLSIKGAIRKWCFLSTHLIAIRHSSSSPWIEFLGPWSQHRSCFLCVLSLFFFFVLFAFSGFLVICFADVF